MSTISQRHGSKLPTAEAPAPTIITIGVQGEIKFLYDDALAGLLDEGAAQITRASHVEPCGTQWQADMSPVGGEVLGPFSTRSEALAAEVAYLNEFYL